MKLLAVFAPLALAATIPAMPEEWPASLDVQKEMITWTKMNITIENKSPKAFNILKAGSILDDNRLESMRLSAKNEYCAMEFSDSRTPPHTNPRDESEFQLMPAYGKITTTIDLLDVRDAYKFCGNGTAVLSIKATFHAAEVGNTTLVHEIPYALDFAAVYHEFFPPLPKAFEERVHKCSPDYLSVLKEGITNCASLATAAREAALNGSAERMEAYFKDSSQDTRNSVADVFAKVAAMCNFENSRVYYTCNHWATKDIGYGLLSSTGLDKDESLQNADSYALFSDAVYLKEDGLNQTRANAEWKRTRSVSYDSSKLGNLTRSEFLSLPPAVRAARFGFEL
ncbi:Neutral protease 2 MEP5 [Beauveria bassiana]|uniref:deuterolysin n=1 Tax=Beauveria bassiana TaxID=176275 RepID=A0A2N6NKU1_BEABA|nr:Neutral protease 2 MEP5 [Beauveria bassiana]